MRERPPGVRSWRWPVPMAWVTSASPRSLSSSAERLLRLAPSRLATEPRKACASAEVCDSDTAWLMDSVVRLKLTGGAFTTTSMLVLVSAPSPGGVCVMSKRTCAECQTASAYCR